VNDVDGALFVGKRFDQLASKVFAGRAQNPAR